MKKQISILLLTLSLTFAFAAPKTPKGTKLSVKKKFAIEGVELGSISWGKGTLTAKGEILSSLSGDYRALMDSWYSGEHRDTGKIFFSPSNNLSLSRRKKYIKNNYSNKLMPS